MKINEQSSWNRKSCQTSSKAEWGRGSKQVGHSLSRPLYCLRKKDCWVKSHSFCKTTQPSRKGPTWHSRRTRLGSGNRLGKAGRISIGMLHLLISYGVQVCTLHLQGHLWHGKPYFSRLRGRTNKGNPQVLSTGGDLRADSGWTLWLEAWAVG